MNIKCPHCGTEYEVEKSDMYHYTKCEVCGKDFVIGSTTTLLGSDSEGTTATSVSTPPAASVQSRQQTNPVPISRSFAGVVESSVGVQDPSTRNRQGFTKKEGNKNSTLIGGAFANKHLIAYGILGSVILLLVSMLIFRDTQHDTGSSKNVFVNAIRQMSVNETKTVDTAKDEQGCGRTEKAAFSKNAERYDLKFKASKFNVIPEDKDRIEQSTRLEFAKSLFASLCFDQSRYFYIQKRLDLSIISARVTDRRWKALLEAQANENWLEMMNIIEGDEARRRFDKYPEETKIVSVYNKLLEHKFNVEVKLKNSGVPSPNFGREVPGYHAIADCLRCGMSESEMRERYKEKYDQYKKFSYAVENMNYEATPYPIDLEVCARKVESSGDIESIWNYSPNSPYRCKGGDSVSFKFSIGDRALYLLFVDDIWYWEQRISEPLREKMSRYVDKRNSYCSEMGKLGKAIYEQEQYTKTEALAKFNEINGNYQKILFASISEFMGKSIVLPPDFRRPPETNDNNGRYASLHKRNDSVISKDNMERYEESRNRFEDYKESAERQSQIEQRKRENAKARRSKQGY